MPKEIELPVCPQCGTVSKVPGRYFSSGKDTNITVKCVGPEGKGHKAVKMEMTLFREVPNERPS